MSEASEGRSDPLIAAGPAGAHLAALRAAGASTRSMAAAAGVSRRTVCDVLAGRRVRIREGVGRRLLALTTADSPPGHALVDATATVRAIAHLEELGYSRMWIAEQLGASDARLHVARRQRVRERTERAVLGLEDRVAGRPPGAER
jgi:hypothetical protein